MRTSCPQATLLHAREHIAETMFHFIQHHDTTTFKEEGITNNCKAIVLRNKKSVVQCFAPIF